ncbi:FSH1 domain-containing protein [Penicillium ucsense]|uniref:FSH1 domain-containing protein n=1 Tax=Penicillium ucsense TaxID=2839758 RepID=A0A8J8W7C2_9EURO|nr:FSH1 domain-containing protein [Penicillium ucsense]KAF7735267.1 FSH1 domain-containing protein [Penicillium ucsense]
MQTAEQKPAILCFHGHGSNGEIFKTQSQKIVRLLSPRFQFLFLDSPITTSQAGVGVQPHYAHIKPFRRWHQDENTIGLFDATMEDVQRERKVVRDHLRLVIERERRQGAGAGVVGVMGFSQGTRVATALCLDPELGRDIILDLFEPLEAEFSALPVSIATERLRPPELLSQECWTKNLVRFDCLRPGVQKVGIWFQCSVLASQAAETFVSELHRLWLRYTVKDIFQGLSRIDSDVICDCVLVVVEHLSGAE